MLVKVAIVAQAQPELEAIRYELRNPIRFATREFLSLDEVAVGLKDFAFEVLVLRIGRFSVANVPMLVKIRAYFPQASILLIASEIEPSARFQCRAMPNIKLVHEGAELQDLASMVEKFSRGEDHPGRQHARVRRNTTAEIFDAKTKRKVPAKFLDFAQMGARVQMNTREPLKRNDRIQLHYESATEPGKLHRIEAVVVWQQITSGMVGTIVKGPEQTVGIRFLASL